MRDLKSFFLGSLFAYSASFDKTKPYMHIVALLCLFVFTNKKFAKESFIQIENHEKLVVMFLFSLEHKIMTALSFRLLIKIGGILCAIGYIISTYSLYTKTSKTNTGIYKYARQPYFGGIVLFAVGTCMYLHTYMSLIYCMFMYKKKLDELINSIEEEAMKKDDKYRKYKQTVNKYYFC